jgi:hypothetical protein
MENVRSRVFPCKLQLNIYTHSVCFPRGSNVCRDRKNAVQGAFITDLFHRAAEKGRLSRVVVPSLCELNYDQAIAHRSV